MTVPQVSNKTVSLYVSGSSRIIQTGLLKYYFPLRMADMLGTTSLSALNARNDTIPATDDPAFDNLPNYINAWKIDLTVG